MQDQGRGKGQGKAQGEGRDESQDFRGLTRKCGGWDSRTSLLVSITPRGAFVSSGEVSSLT
jgi:hypothetical protein